MALLSSCRERVRTTPYEMEYPSHFPAPEIPDDNPMTVESIRLGRHLFFDTRLSGDNTQSCADCHLQENNFGDPNQFSTGIDGIQGPVNAMAIVNLAWGKFFFWDGRAASLELQAVEPVVNPIEMHETWENVIAKLEMDAKYENMFEAAYGKDAITKENSGKAMANFMRSMISGNAKIDRYVEGSYSFTAEEQMGFDIYNTEEGDCFHCHGLATTGYQMGAFGVMQFSNNGLDSVLAVGSGREGVTENPTDRGKFKIPSLRNIEYSFPYMHDGRFATLSQVIEHYNEGGHYSATVDPNMKHIGIGHNWSVQQKQALEAFLKTFTDLDYLTDTAYTDPW